MRKLINFDIDKVPENRSNLKKRAENDMVLRIIPLLPLMPIFHCLHSSISLLCEIIYAFYIKINFNQFNKIKSFKPKLKSKCKTQNQKTISYCF